MKTLATDVWTGGQLERPCIYASTRIQLLVLWLGGSNECTLSSKDCGQFVLSLPPPESSHGYRSSRT